MRYNTVITSFIFILVISFMLISCDSREDGIDYEISYLSIIPDSLYADNNSETFSQIDVIIEDDNGYPVPGKTVTFETDLGTIDPQAETSETGHAIAIFQDNGQPGIAHISVSLNIENLTLTDSIKIKPLPYNITSMNITPNMLYADNVMETFSEVNLTVQNEQGFPASGVPVHLYTDLGLLQGVVYTDDSGSANAVFNDNGLPGIAHITAWIDEAYGQVLRDSIEILPNPYLKIVSISATPDTIYLDNCITSSNIEVLVHDQYGFAATNESVYFAASIGNIIAHVNTDDNGLASTNFCDSETTGIALIHAYAGIADTTITVTIIDSDVIEINLDELPSESAVNNVISVSAFALNEIGAVPDYSEITFTTELGFFQAGENDLTPLGTSTVAYTYNGSASVYLNTGNQMGLNHITAQIIAVHAGNVLTDSAEMEILPDEVDHLSFTTPSKHNRILFYD